MTRKLLLLSGLLFGLLNAMAQAPVANFSATPTSGCGPLTVHFTDQSTNKPVYWSWDFGDGNTSNLQNPTNTYRAPGAYTVKLIVRNTSGTNAVVMTNYITVSPYPTPQFTSNLTLACAPATIAFNDQSTPGQGSITSWAWTFGDGSTSNQQNPAHVYSQTGYYTVGLTVTNSGGCSNTNSVTRYIRVVSGIQPNFAFNQSSTSCSAPFTGQLLNQSAGPGNLSFNWTVSNGATPSSSADTSPVVTFPASGQYNVNLQVTSSLGCSASLQQPVNFTNGGATVNGPTTACVNTPVTFSDGSNPAPPSITWTFSDGTTSNSDTISKTFPATGTYPIKLVNKYPTCSDSTVVNVQVVNASTADFAAGGAGIKVACKAPLTVQFSDLTTPAATAWLWDFGDGQTSTVQNPTHTYTAVGNYTVTLTATGAGGCQSTVIKNNFVVIQPPSVTIAGVVNACVASTATFNYISPVASIYAPDGVASYAWTAPGSNEGSSSLATPQFTYNSTGSYTLSLTITTKGGCTASATANVQIGTPITPAFTLSPNPVCSNNPVTFTCTVPAPDYYWVFGDPSSPSTNGPTVTHQYAFYGPHTVSLTITNNGCPQQVSQSVLVDPPFANFTNALDMTQGCSNRSLIQFTDASAEAANNIAFYGQITWSWDFGDPASGANNTSASPTPEHQYPAPTGTPATYNVTLTITQGTCTSTITLPVTIGDITASFTSVPTGIACRNTQVTYTSNSSPVALIGGYSWQVDAQPPTAESSSPTFQTSFTTNGNHSVTLIAYDQNGCPSPPAISNIQINGPIAAFNIPATGGACLNGQAAFTDASTASPSTIASWSWNFGDSASGSNNTSPLQNPIHAYSDTGYFQPLLTVTDAAGCTDTTSRTVQITGPIANFGGPDSFYCPNEPFTFIDSSQGYNLVESWNFGDGSGPQMNPVHSFANSGQTYNVTLTVTDKNNCTNSITKPVRIQSPIAAFNISDTTAICTPLQTFFGAHGQYYDSLYWEFGDGSSSTLDSTSHFYNNYGIDTAKLFVQGPGGCLDSASWRVLITNPFTTTTLTESPLSACDSVPVTFHLGPPSYTSFNLYFGDTATDSSQNLSPFHMYRGPGTYSPALILTDQTGCIVTIPGQNITVLGSTPFFTADKHAFCDSGIVNFTDYTISNDGFASETYNFGDGSPTQTQTPGNGSFNTNHDYDIPGFWTASLKVSTNSGCSETYSDTIHVYQTPHPVITLPKITCTGVIQFQGSENPPLDTVNWLWNFGNGDTAQIQNPAVQLEPGNFTVTLRTSIPYGCADTTSTPITVYTVPQIHGPKEITTPLGIPVTIPFTYSPDVTMYNWTPTNNLSCSDCANPVATLTFATTYMVTVTDANSCSASDTILIKTICNDNNYFFPNTFSPNGDGINDYFYPRGVSLYNIQSLTIFNRWGQMVFQRRNFPANDQSMGWDGTFAGKPAPADAYVFVAEVICENAQVITIGGNVTLIR